MLVKILSQLLRACAYSVGLIVVTAFVVVAYTTDWFWVAYVGVVWEAGTLVIWLLGGRGVLKNYSNLQVAFVSVVSGLVLVVFLLWVLASLVEYGLRKGLQLELRDRGMKSARERDIALGATITGIVAVQVIYLTTISSSVLWLWLVTGLVLTYSTFHLRISDSKVEDAFTWLVFGIIAPAMVGSGLVLTIAIKLSDWLKTRKATK